MIKVLLFFYYTVIVLICSSCKSQAQQDVNGIQFFNKFPKETTILAEHYLQLNEIRSDVLSLYDELYIYRDSLLFLANLAGAKTNHFIVYNLHNKSFVKSFLEYGGKKGNSFGFISFGIRDSNFWVNDIIKKKFILRNIDGIINGNDTITKEYPMPVFYYSSQLLNDSIILGSGDYNSNYKLVKRNISNGSIVEEMFPYNREKSSTNWSMIQKTAYESFLYLHPNGQKSVLAARYADQIEIFDLVKQRSIVVKGPDNFEPRLKTMIDNIGNKISTPTPNTKLAFVRGHVTNKFIYLLYSGNKDFTKDKDFGRYVYIYDWEGNPVKKINFKDNVVDFVVSQNNSVLYFYTPGLPIIYSSKL